MSKLLLALAPLLFLAACAGGATKPSAQARPTNIATIGVVSLVGDSIELSSSGFAGLGGDFDRTFVPSWRFKDLIEQAAASDLAPSYRAVGVSFDAAAFRRFVDPVAMPTSDALKRALQAALANGNTADAFLVITPGTTRDSSFPGPSDISGIGVFHTTAVVSSDTIYPFVVADLTLIDAHDFRVISTTPLRLPAKDTYKNSGYPILALEGFEWQSKFTAMTPAQGQQLYQIWRDLLIKTIRFSMAQLKLT